MGLHKCADCWDSPCICNTTLCEHGEWSHYIPLTQLCREKTEESLSKVTEERNEAVELLRDVWQAKDMGEVPLFTIENFLSRIDKEEK